MGIALTLFRSVISAGCSARGRVQPTAARSNGMASLAPPLAVRAGAAAEGAAPRGEQPEIQQQQEQRQKREKKPKPPPPPRPTHFLALQVSQHPGVSAAIGTVQASLRRHSPHLKKACVDAASAHLTLGVMALSSEGERARAAEVLAALAEPLRKAALLAPVQVQLEGLSHFKHQVLYLYVRPDGGLEQLMALAAAARAHFKDAGLLLQADQPFVPHVTIAKTSKLQGWGKQAHGWGGGKGHGGHGRSRGDGHGGGTHERHNWRADRRQERQAKQQRLEMQAAEEEALAGWDWGRQGEEGNSGGNGGASRAAGSGLPAVGQPAADAPGGAGAEASASAAVMPASATEPPSSNNNNDASVAAAAAGAAAGKGAEEAEQAAEEEPQRSQQAQQAQQAHHGGRKRPHDDEGAADPPAHHSGGGWRQIDAEAWAQHAAIEGGSVLIGELQLCAMQGRKPDEYYPVLCSLPLVAGEAADTAAAAPPGGEGQAGGTGLE